MRDEVEELIVDWLKSDNENTTYLAHQICVLFGVGNNEALELSDGVAVCVFLDMCQIKTKAGNCRKNCKHYEVKQTDC